MNFDYEKQLLDYLQKNYIVKQYKYYSTHEDIHIWGYKIASSLPIIFSLEYEFCLPIFKLWANANGLIPETYELAWSSNLFSEEFGIDADGQLSGISQDNITRLFDPAILRMIDKIRLKGE